MEKAACAAFGGARRESLASDSAACAGVGEPRPLRQIKRSAHRAGLFSFCEAKNAERRESPVSSPRGSKELFLGDVVAPSKVFAYILFPRKTGFFALFLLE